MKRKCKENVHDKDIMKKFHDEAKEKGFVKKVNEKRYKNENGDVFELCFLAPYTIKIKFV